MPSIQVPLQRPATATTSTIRISYTLLGNGPVLVILIPGLCVPSSMYDNLSTVLASTGQFTTITLDNRGIGKSSIPNATLLHAPGYTISNLAKDSWAVVDNVMQTDEDNKYRKQIGIIGHSMGGMIAQAMIMERPLCVSFLALLATHAGGWRNLIPSYELIYGIGRLIWSKFDKHVNANVNLDWHFTEQFLNDVVGWERLNIETGIEKELLNTQLKKIKREQDQLLVDNNDINYTNTNNQIHKTTTTRNQTSIITNKNHSKEHLPINLGFFESKMVEITHDAYIYFGLTRTTLSTHLSQPHRLLLSTLSHTQPPPHQRQRREIYHARYIGLEKHHLEEQESPPTTPTNTPTTSSSELSSDDDYLSTKFGHLRVVLNHSLPVSFGKQLARCSHIVKLVVVGRHDCVVTPNASRRLAHLINANTLMEVNAKHFLVDEAAAQVATQMVYGLRKAFFEKARPKCNCEWCTTTTTNTKPNMKSYSNNLMYRLLIMMSILCLFITIAIILSFTSFSFSLPIKQEL